MFVRKRRPTCRHFVHTVVEKLDQSSESPLVTGGVRVKETRMKPCVVESWLGASLCHCFVRLWKKLPCLPELTGNARRSARRDASGVHQVTEWPYLAALDAASPSSFPAGSIARALFILRNDV